MRGLLAAGGLLAASVALGTAAIAASTSRNDQLTIAVFGDWPYNTLLLDNADLLLKSVNGDADVSWVVHVGDIHSGSMPCTSAGILPPIPASNPGWNQGVYTIFQQFKPPVVYTPGDNEWTDCWKYSASKPGELKSGDPLKELASVRGLFFARPGHTLGLQDKEVFTQAVSYDEAHPEDAQFVENVMWEDAKVMFVTVNMPGGSNNDTDPWGVFENQTARENERDQRTEADKRWLQAAFAEAQAHNDKAVVVALQADMWDPEAQAANKLGEYKTFVQALADATRAFPGQVLLLNGDSHRYLVDYPLADRSSTTGQIYDLPPVTNLTRIVVQGSTNAPAEWLRLTIDGRKPYPFSWSNVSYCTNPNSAC